MKPVWKLCPKANWRQTHITIKTMDINNTLFLGIFQIISPITVTMTIMSIEKEIPKTLLSIVPLLKKTKLIRKKTTATLYSNKIEFE
jgi:hypothetical protein